jgi:hypothetical protein
MITTAMMETCPVCTTAVFQGPNARASLIRHLRDKAKLDEPHRVLHQELTITRNPTGESAIKLRRKREARYRATRSSRSTATKQFSKIKSVVKVELYKQHDDIKPQKSSRPKTPDLDIITKDNRYRLLEEHVGIFASRRRKLYKWANVDKVILHYNLLYYVIFSLRNIR